MSVSERTHRDEILRRQGGKPLKIIDHGKGSATSSKAWKDDVSDRPLRLPLVKSMTISLPTFYMRKNTLFLKFYL